MSAATVHRRIRVLHVVGGMNRGGVETWLMHLLRHIDERRFDMQFLVHTERACAFDAEIRALGSAVIPCLDPADPRRYARTFRRILAARMPYDVVHSHVHHFSGLVLRVAAQTGVPLRIAHSHNDTAALHAGVPRRLYLRLMRRWIGAHATHGLAASRAAAAALFGASWERDPRHRVLPYALDFAPFYAPVDRAAVRAALGLPADALVVGHVGRFDPQKNHRFVVEVFAALAREDPRARLVLVGDGRLRSTVEAQVHAAGLDGRVLFLGIRDDVATLMRAFDVFVFPSLYEGLGIVLVEAQAAGVPCVVTRTLPTEADVVPGLVTRLALAEPPSAWAHALRAAANAAISPATALRIVERSPFNIAHGLAALQTLYAAAAHDDALPPTRVEATSAPARVDAARTSACGTTAREAATP